uniref:(northern house mosquito) hypothetical protein n=1 Tax=Culex pipiens TaxID=7175 RepID=A0A8D8FMG8_CULPI
MRWRRNLPRGNFPAPHLHRLGPPVPGRRFPIFAGKVAAVRFRSFLPPSGSIRTGSAGPLRIPSCFASWPGTATWLPSFCGRTDSLPFGPRAGNRHRTGSCRS